MYDFLGFIDSPDIREYNRNTEFTPAEQAVLISMSDKTTVEEKIEALQYLADHYTEEEFRKDSITSDWAGGDGGVRIRDVVLETIRVWKCALDARYNNEGVIYSAEIGEREYDGGSNNKCCYFSDYDKAYEYLTQVKKHYTDEVEVHLHCDEPIILYGVINRIKLDTNDPTVGETYYFDHDLQLVSLIDDEERKEDVPYLLADYLAFIPLPFRKGDIVKVESLYSPTYYGVVSCDWERPEDPDRIIMWISLEVYIKERNVFDYTDGTGDCVLGYSFCSYEELPEDERMLKLISDVRKGEMDFYLLLHKYSVHELDVLLEWQTRNL